MQKLLRHPYCTYLFEQAQLQEVLQEIKKKLGVCKTKHLELTDELLQNFLTPCNSANLLQKLQALIDRLKETLITEKASLASENTFSVSEKFEAFTELP